MIRPLVRITETALRRLYAVLQPRYPGLRRLVPIARRVKRRLRLPASRSAGSSASGCARCRALDSWEETQLLRDDVVRALRSAGLNAYTLPSQSGLRLGITPCATDDQVAEVLNAIRKRPGTSVSSTSFDIANNLYEFDQRSAVPPSEGEFYTARLSPHCSRGKSYLKRRRVTVERTADADGSVLVLRKGLGPRVYDRDRWESLATSPGVPAIPSWPFPIDLVFTWVDDQDPSWQARRRAFSPGSDLPSASANAARWRSRDELLYALRSMWMYAPWVRRVFLVTDQQTPSWLRPTEWLSVVDHRDLYPDANVLPTFNSNHIETVLHRIDGLTEHFIYCNDDFFFAGPSKPHDYFTPGGIGKLFFSNRFLDARPVGPYDRATVASHKNSRDALQRALSCDAAQKFKHAPYTMRRSVWNEMEDVFADELSMTRAQRFRSRTDVNGQFLYAHYALATGRAVPAPLRYAYHEIAEENFPDVVKGLESAKIQFFCLNDSNSDEQNIDLNDDHLAAFLGARFPVPSPYEKGSPVRREGSPPIFIRSSSSWQIRYYLETSRLGSSAAAKVFQRRWDSTGDVDALQMLVTLARDSGATDRALAFLPHLYPDRHRRSTATIDLLSEADAARLEELIGLADPGSPQQFQQTIGYLGRSVTNDADADLVRKYYDSAPAAWRADPRSPARLAGVVRRAGRPREAVEILAATLVDLHALAEPGSHSVTSRRDDRPLEDPYSVLKDALEIAARVEVTLFPDAGTMLGFHRDGDFIGHDYDIDLGTRAAESSFEELANAYRADWRFRVARVRTPESLIQMKHINGSQVDIFRHIPDGEWWLKRSHVYGWRVGRFELTTRRFANDLEIAFIEDADSYLEEMYGPDWRIPQSDFDSRTDAPNVFFPDIDEMRATLLNKAVNATLDGDDDAMNRAIGTLSSKLDYELPRLTCHADAIP